MLPKDVEITLNAVDLVIISTKGHISVELVRQAKFVDFKKLKAEIELQK